MSKPMLVLCCLLLLWGCSGEGGGTTDDGTGGDPAAGGEKVSPFQAATSPEQSGFAPNSVCADCHQEQFAAWQGSHHELAMQVADEGTVLGDFSDATLTVDGVTTRFFLRDGGFWVNTPGADGVPADFRIDYVFGVHPLQQYLIAMPGGRLQCLVASWDDVEKRWFNLYPHEEIKPGDPYHWTGRYQNWNLMCAECHSTDLRENYDHSTDTYATTWAEINVSCQACHGPGQAHVAWAQGSEPAAGGMDSGAESRAETSGNGLTVDFAAGDAAYQVETCAPCHARRHRVSGEDLHGQRFMQDFMPALLREGLYHADGRILDEVYVYGSFVQSKMFRAGVRCTDCHDPHGLGLKDEGNAVCTGCHQALPDRRFPTLRAATYDHPDHHHHAPGSPGAACVACHMPATTYMVVDPRRDHSLRIPRPDLSVKLGTPDACTGCHQEETRHWAAKVVAGWYPDSRLRQPHFAEVLARGRAGERHAGPDLAALAQAEDEAAIVRATAMELLGHYNEGEPVLLAGLADPDPMIRATAIHGLTGLPPARRLESIAPLLEDPIRAVRVEAVRNMASVPPGELDDDQRAAFKSALDELMETLRADADTPGAHLNMGTLAAAGGQAELAAEAFLKALALDPGFLPARFNLANLYNALGRNREAEAILRQGIETAPEEGELFYSLGLLLAEDRHYQEAAGALGSAVELMPERPRAHYNYGLVAQQLGDLDAEAALLRSYELDHDDLRTVHALGMFYAGQQLWERARPFASRLDMLAPGHPATEELVARVRRGLAAGAGD